MAGVGIPLVHSDDLLQLTKGQRLLGRQAMITVKRGEGPLVLVLPHCGQEIPPFISGRLSAEGRNQIDISWHLEQVFDLADELDATVLGSTASRYVVDVDVAVEQSEQPEPGVPFNALCPEKSLSGDALYERGQEPGPVEAEQRVLLFHAPFHRTLAGELLRLKGLHDRIIVVDCKSVRSRIPDLTDHGQPVFSIGADERSCSPQFQATVMQGFSDLDGFSAADGGAAAAGYIRRTYGSPDSGVEAFSLVLAQRAYLLKESVPFEPDPARVRRLKRLLTGVLTEIVSSVQDGKHGQTEKVGKAPSDDVLFDDGLVGPVPRDAEG